MATRPLRPRKAQRTTRHTSCELDVGGKTFTGVIVDLSATGLFVRTNIQPAEGAAVRVIMRRPGGQIWELQTQVASVARLATLAEIAAAAAILGEDHPSILAARDLWLAGNTLLDTADFLGAIAEYRAATQALR